MPPERCLVATWPDGYKWPVPNTTADMQPDEAKKVDKILWKSVDPRSGQPVQVIEISHAERGVWIVTRIQPKIQLMQLQGYGDHNSDKAKKFMNFIWSDTGDLKGHQRDQYCAKYILCKNP